MVRLAFLEIALGSHERIWIATSEMKDCFYSMQAPSRLRLYLSLPSVSRAEAVSFGLVGAYLTLGRGPVGVPTVLLSTRGLVLFA